MAEPAEHALPDDNDVIISFVEERNGLDVYRVTKGTLVIGEYTGRSTGASVFRVAVDNSEPGRCVWLKDELGLRPLKAASDDEFDL